MRHLTSLALVVLALPAAGCARRATIADRMVAREAGLPDHAAQVMVEYGSDLRRLVGMDSLGEPVPAAGLTVAATEDRAPEIVRELRARVEPGYVVFRSEQNYNRGLDRVAILKAGDQLDALRVMGTNGVNYGISADSVLAVLRAWEPRYGLRVVGAGMDWAELEITRPPADWLAFAREVYAFCPDVVDQGTETVERLAGEMRRRSILYLWWD